MKILKWIRNITAVIIIMVLSFLIISNVNHMIDMKIKYFSMLNINDRMIKSLDSIQSNINKLKDPKYLNIYTESEIEAITSYQDTVDFFKKQKLLYDENKKMNYLEYYNYEDKIYDYLPLLKTFEIYKKSKSSEEEKEMFTILAASTIYMTPKSDWDISHLYEYRSNYLKFINFDYYYMSDTVFSNKIENYLYLIDCAVDKFVNVDTLTEKEVNDNVGE